VKRRSRFGEITGHDGAKYAAGNGILLMTMIIWTFAPVVKSNWSQGSFSKFK
jgi:hypothetical protein